MMWHVVLAAIKGITNLMTCLHLKSSHCNTQLILRSCTPRFRLQVPNLEVSCSYLTKMSTKQIIVPPMTTMRHAFLNMFPNIEYFIWNSTGLYPDNTTICCCAKKLDLRAKNTEYAPPSFVCFFVPMKFGFQILMVYGASNIIKV